jgi:hypothetical protein
MFGNAIGVGRIFHHIGFNTASFGSLDSFSKCTSFYACFGQMSPNISFIDFASMVRK